MTTSRSTSAETGPDAGTRLIVCHACDWISRLAPRAPGQRARCPRCDHHLTEAAQRDAQKPLAWASATLVMLGLVFCFPFLSFSAYGVGHVMAFGDTLHALVADDYGVLAVVLMAFTVVLPGAYLVALVYLCLAIQLGRALPGQRLVARSLRPIEPWMMSDVFIVGVLVSLIKIISLAQIQVHLGFVAFCIYSVMLLRTATLIDWTSLWDRLVPPPATPAARAGATASAQGFVACRGCDTPYRAADHRHCPRCGKRHWLHHVDRVQLTWALLVTAAIAYVPANVYPVLSTTQLGSAQAQTIAGGVIHLMHSGDWPIATVIFVASIIVPISKIVALAWLCIAARRPRARASHARTRLFHWTERVGRWSMIDVFVVVVLTTLVQAGSLMSIQPGTGAVAFALVVVLTMIAALTFDTRLLWATHPSDTRPVVSRPASKTPDPA